MIIQDQFTEEMLGIYSNVGMELGYWAQRYLQLVRRHGGLIAAKRLLDPKSKSQGGFRVLLENNRQDLSVEALVLRPEYASLFSEEELRIARNRLANYDTFKPSRGKNELLFPDELTFDMEYVEGARTRIIVNAFERSSEARDKCLAHYGYNCSVCNFSFEAKFGKMGEKFIHVHHLNPISRRKGKYKLNAIRDLRPVCPNCHAMLHRSPETLSIENLRALIEESAQ